jgi:uncharacterized membrane protein
MTMDTMLKLGRLFFAVPIAAFGIQYFLYGRFVGGLAPVPPWTPGGWPAAYLTGAVLLAAGIAIAAKWKVRWFATLLGIFFLLCVLLLHTQRWHDVIYDGVGRTRAFEPLAIAAAAFVLAGTFPPEPASSPGWNSVVDLAAKLGLYLFTFSMLIFGIQHFLYAPFIASLIPSWMPAHLDLAFFTGGAFIAAALSITFKVLGRLAAISLGWMFLLWTILLHAPRVAGQIRNGDEWSSLLVALALSGGSFVIAQALSGKAVAQN